MVRTYTSTLLMLLSACTIGFAQQHKTVKKATPNDARPEQPCIAININSGGYLGVHLDEVTAKTVTDLKLPEERGAVIVDVIEKSPAADAGLQKNDVVIWWNDTRVESAAQFSRLVRETPPGRSVKIGVIRNGAETKLTAKIAGNNFMNMPMDFHFNGDFMKSLDSLPEHLSQVFTDSNGTFMKNLFMPGRGRLGVQLQDLSEQLGKYFGVTSGGGALISDVEKDSPAAKAGLEAGDVITAVDGEKVSDPSDLRHIIRAKKEGTVDLTVVRNKTEQHIKAVLPKEDAHSMEELNFEPPAPPEMEGDLH